MRFEVSERWMRDRDASRPGLRVAPGLIVDLYQQSINQSISRWTRAREVAIIYHALSMAACVQQSSIDSRGQSIGQRFVLLSLSRLFCSCLDKAQVLSLCTMGRVLDALVNASQSRWHQRMSAFNKCIDSVECQSWTSATASTATPSIATVINAYQAS